MADVKVKLKQLSFVHGARRPKGEIVELPETAPDENGDPQPFAALFGDIVSDDTPLSPDPVSGGRKFGGLHEAEDDDA
jgi:hypothetical protein